MADFKMGYGAESFHLYTEDIDEEFLRHQLEEIQNAVYPRTVLKETIKKAAMLCAFMNHLQKREWFGAMSDDPAKLYRERADHRCTMRMFEKMMAEGLLLDAERVWDQNAPPSYNRPLIEDLRPEWTHNEEKKK